MPIARIRIDGKSDEEFAGRVYLCRGLRRLSKLNITILTRDPCRLRAKSEKKRTAQCEFRRGGLADLL
jgi:hypothetical protein